MPRRKGNTRTPSTGTIGGFKPPVIELMPVTNFTGGLNLNADMFQLGDTESPDMQNVDVSVKGGIERRNVITNLHATELSAQPRSIWEFNPSGQILVQIGNDFAYSTGGNFTTVNPDALTVSSGAIMRAATFKNVNYIQRYAEQVPISWDGSSATVIGALTFDENIAAPSGTNLPKAKCITAHRGYLWVANTVEPIAGTKKNRVRWSHANTPTSWRANDYIDIDDGVDGDEIVAIMGFKDRLIVFKQNTTHAINGYSADTFAVVTVSNESGAISQEAVCASESALYYFSWPDGVMRFDGAKVVWLFEKLQPITKDGRIPSGQQGKIACAWMNRRLHVAVPFGTSASYNTNVFVWDPVLGPKSTGGWMRHTIEVGPMIEWQPPGVGATALGCSRHGGSGDEWVIKFDQSGTQDNYGSGALDVDSYFVTKWFDPTDPIQRKRWRRPEFVLDSDSTATLRVDVFKDFEPTVVRRTFNISVTALPDVSVPTVWDTDDWDTELYWNESVIPAGRQQLVRGLGIGNARSVQLKITGSSDSAKWGINEVGFKFLPKRIR